MPDHASDSSTRLFGDFARTRERSKRHNESLYSFYDKSAWPACEHIRNLMDAWYSHYPDEARRPLRHRFRHRHKFYSAFFELYLHELMRRLRWPMEIEPTVRWTRRRPDFAVEDSSGNAAWIEALTTSGDTGPEVRHDAIIGALYDKLDTIRSPDFYLQLHPLGRMTRRPNLGAWREQVASWIFTLNYDEVKRSQGTASSREHTLILGSRGSQVRVSVWTKEGSARGRLDRGAMSGSSHMIKEDLTSRNLQMRLTLKAAGLRGAPGPMLLAVNVLDGFAGSRTIAEAVMGNGEARNGIETERGFFRPDDHTWISGVLVAFDCWPSSVRISRLHLYHNPWALHECNLGSGIFPSDRWEMGSKGLDHRSEPGTLNPKSLFELPLNWPGPPGMQSREGW